jgi:hypothetical protein
MNQKTAQAQDGNGSVLRHLGSMTRCVLLLGVLLMIEGCSNSEDDMPGYAAHSGDLGGFVIAAATRLGAQPQKTNGLPEIKVAWHSKDDDQRTEVFISGNFFPQLHQFMTNAFGPLPERPQTNNAAEKQSIVASYGTNAGPGLNYSWERDREGKEFTTLMISKVSRPVKSP